MALEKEKHPGLKYGNGNPTMLELGDIRTFSRRSKKLKIMDCNGILKLPFNLWFSVNGDKDIFFPAEIRSLDEVCWWSVVSTILALSRIEMTQVMINRGGESSFVIVRIQDNQIDAELLEELRKEIGEQR